MPRGDKSKYTEKQQRQAEHIERAMSSAGSRRRGGAARLGTVNKMTGGGKKSDRPGRPINKAPAKKGGRRVVRPRPHVRLPRAPAPRRKQLRPVSAAPCR